MSAQSPKKIPPTSDNVSGQDKNDMEHEMLDKLPDKTTNAQEWGQRYTTGKDIATGGDLDPPPNDDSGEDHAVKRPRDTYLETDDNAVVRVYCSHCKEQIGRVQTEPADETGDEAERFRQEAQGELELIANEHRLLCQGKLA